MCVISDLTAIGQHTSIPRHVDVTLNVWKQAPAVLTMRQDASGMNPYPHIMTFYTMEKHSKMDITMPI